uniref:Transmembrane protein 18 n=1 Tax=Palpitomonas bilix TaxID=652834 RepID=A0A7S3D6U9_9EUKA|mmetsp:Transcript_24588/g.62243  ORF Transcript_24588/g.62243 Transcript_24588/m.62243 type:complete len:184 (+) Transcript_24588:76-627(+)
MEYFFDMKDAPTLKELFPFLDAFSSVSAEAEMRKMYDGAMGFYHAVTWTEPFIVGLGLFHIFVLIVAILIRKSVAGRLILFVVLQALVYFSETFNSYGAAHWEEFATQNYFDKQGFFAVVLFCGPLVMIGFLILALSLCEAAGLLVQVKAKQIRAEKKKEAAQATEMSDGQQGKKGKKKAKSD